MIPRRTFIAAPLVWGASSALARAQCAPGGPAAMGFLSSRAANLVPAETFLIPTEDRAGRLHLRNKGPRDPAAPRADRTVLFVHGLTYPAGGVFDLPLQGYSWMDYLAARGFDVWGVDIRGFGQSSRPDDFSRPSGESPPYLDAGTATTDLAAAACRA